MNPIVLLFKSLIPAHTRRLRTGKVINVRQYTDKRTKRLEDDQTLDMFADEVTTPRKELIDEHKRLVDVLESPSRKDDKVEAKKQKEELEEYEAKPRSRIINPLTVNIFNPPEHGDTVRFANYDEGERDWVVQGEFGGWSLYRNGHRHPTIHNIPAMVDFIRAMDSAAHNTPDEDGPPAPEEQRGGRFPKDFGISPHVRTWATRRGFGDLEPYLNAFVATYRAEGAPQKADWDAAFMTAINDDQFGVRGQKATIPPRPPKVTSVTQKDAPTPEEAADPRRKYYVTMMRDGEKRVARLAGPFDTHDEAKAMVDKAREKAYEADPRAFWDAFGTSSVVSDNHVPGVLNDVLGVQSAPAPKPADDHPAPKMRASTSSLSEADRARWLSLHQQQHEIHYHDRQKLGDQMDRVRSKRNKAETAMREAEAGLKGIRSAPVRDPERELEFSEAVDKARAEFDQHAKQLDTMASQHEILVEREEVLGKQKNAILPGSGDLRMDLMSGSRISLVDEADRIKDYKARYRDYFKTKPTKTPKVVSVRAA